MYFIWGEEEYLIDFHTKSLIEKIGLMPIYFDSESQKSEIITEIDTVSLFGVNKLIVLKDLDVLKETNFSQVEDLFRSIKHASDSVILIFTLNIDKPSYTNHLVKFLLDHAQIIEAKKPQEKEIVGLVKTIIVKKHGSISNRAALKMVMNLPNNLYIINQEIDKLLLESTEIDEEQVDISIAKYNKANAFALSNAIVGGNSFDIIATYKNEVDEGTDPIEIINQLANNFELAALIEGYKDLGYSLEEIAKKTSIHIYRIAKVNQILENQFTYSISSILKRLAKLDNKIKAGLVVPQRMLDKFILDIIRN